MASLKTKLVLGFTKEHYDNTFTSPLLLKKINDFIKLTCELLSYRSCTFYIDNNNKEYGIHIQDGKSAYIDILNKLNYLLYKFSFIH